MLEVRNSLLFGNARIMSRLGKLPIQVPAGVEVSFQNGTFTVKGPKGTLSRAFQKDVAVSIENGVVTLTPDKKSVKAPALWGTYAAHVRNMIKGVTEGFVKKLEIEGVGYRAEAQGQKIKLAMGFSHPVELFAPEGVSILVEKSIVTISGADIEAVGQFASDVRAVREPEPYKGKGIHYVGEYIIRKQGKKGAG
jgi:large subunit ribosomal protein L6